MGNKDDILEAEKFNDVMMDLVRFSLVSRSHTTVPAGLDPVEDINKCIERTRSGLVLGMSPVSTSIQRFGFGIYRLFCLKVLPTKEFPFLWIL